MKIVKAPMTCFVVVLFIYFLGILHVFPVCTLYIVTSPLNGHQLPVHILHSAIHSAILYSYKNISVIFYL